MRRAPAVRLPQTVTVGQLHIHCCLKNLETANGEDIRDQNILLDVVIKQLESEDEQLKDKLAEDTLMGQKVI